MPDRKRVALIVHVDLDPVPGTMHTHESAQEVVKNLLINSIPHYWPEVHLAQVKE